MITEFLNLETWTVAKQQCLVGMHNLAKKKLTLFKIFQPTCGSWPKILLMNILQFHWDFQKGKNEATLFMFYGKMYLMFVNPFR